MKLTSTLSKLGSRFVLTALAGGITIASVGLSQAANAAGGSYHRTSVQSGPYHQDVLPDGTLTGPIGPDANGG